MNNSLSVDTHLTQLRGLTDNSDGPDSGLHTGEAGGLSPHSMSSLNENGSRKGIMGVTQQEVSSFFSPADKSLSNEEFLSSPNHDSTGTNKSKLVGRPEITKIHSRVHTRILIQTGSTTQAKTFTYHQQYPASPATPQTSNSVNPTVDSSSFGIPSTTLAATSNQPQPIQQQQSTSRHYNNSPGDSELDNLALQMGLLSSIPSSSENPQVKDKENEMTNESSYNFGDVPLDESIIVPSQSYSSSMSPNSMIGTHSSSPMDSSTTANTATTTTMRHKRSRTGTSGLLSGLLRRFSPRLKRRSKSISPSRQMTKSSSMRGASPSVQADENSIGSNSKAHSRTGSREGGGNAFSRFFRSKRFLRNGSRADSYGKDSSLGKQHSSSMTKSLTISPVCVGGTSAADQHVHVSVGKGQNARADSRSNASSVLGHTPSGSVEQMIVPGRTTEEEQLDKEAEAGVPPTDQQQYHQQQLNLKFDSLRRDRVSSPYEQFKNSLQHNRGGGNAMDKSTPVHSSIGSSGSGAVQALKAVHPLPPPHHHPPPPLLPKTSMTTSLPDYSPSRPSDLGAGVGVAAGESYSFNGENDGHLTNSSHVFWKDMTSSASGITPPSSVPSYVNIAVSAYGYSNYNYLSQSKSPSLKNMFDTLPHAASSPPPPSAAASAAQYPKPDDDDDDDDAFVNLQENNNHCVISSSSTTTPEPSGTMSKNSSPTPPLRLTPSSNGSRSSVVTRSQSTACDSLGGDEKVQEIGHIDETDGGTQTSTNNVAMRRKRTRSTSEARQRSSLIMMQVAQASPRGKLCMSGSMASDSPNASLTRSFTAGSSGQEHWSCAADWQMNSLSLRPGHCSTGVSPMPTPNLMTPTMEHPMHPIGESMNFIYENEQEAAEESVFDNHKLASNGEKMTACENDKVNGSGGGGDDSTSATEPSTPQHTCNSNNEDDVKDGRYFLVEVARVEGELVQKIHQVELDLVENEGKLTEEVDGQLRTAVGKANLLIHDKFAQFRGLCDENLHQKAMASLGDVPPTLDAGHFLTLSSDLEGFWAMVELQVDDVGRMFNEIDQLRSSNWIPPPSQTRAPEAPRVRKVVKTTPNVAVPKPKENSRAAEARKRLLAAKREAMQKMRDLATDEAGDRDVIIIQ